MTNNIIGRENEQAILKSLYESQRAEFVAIYGRRRIGKTFLVKQYFKNNIDFYATGIYRGTKEEQLVHFSKQINTYSKGYYPVPKDWFEAFDMLKTYLSQLSSKKRVVAFIDELPWFDTHKSRFVKAFELFWNSWASDQENLLLIVCGSATTWMTSKLIGDKGGLHNRITKQIYLAPFSLRESAELIKRQGVELSAQQIAECYMIMGGVPYYLSKLEKGRSFSQNIDALFFSKNAELKIEYEFLFKSLFDNSQLYQRVVDILSKKKKGMTRKEIVEGLGIADNGNLTTVLNDLCLCDFVRKYSGYGKKERDVIYQLSDMYILFYTQFVEGNNGLDSNYWSNMADNPAKRAWSGFAFEQLCLHHIDQIKSALGISGVQTNVYSWVCRDAGQGAQIDLVIDRRDDVINLCEMKYSSVKYEMTSDYADWMEERKELFRQKTKTDKALHLTLVTLKGVKPNMHSNILQNVICIGDLIK